MTQDTAKKYNLRTLADLCPVAGQLTLGAPKQFETRPDGVPALKSIYGINFKAFKPLDVGGPVTVSSLKNGQVDAADLFSTDPAIKGNNFVALTDSRNQFAAQNIVPLRPRRRSPRRSRPRPTRCRPSWTRTRWPAWSPRCRTTSRIPRR